jgi:LytS/YehU family sensor histidine kinase
MVERLAALLRFSLDAHQHPTIPLRDELKLVSDYLQIEKARFGKRLSYELAVPEELNAAAVPPFTLQTLVENSIKHAVATHRKGGALAVKAFAASDTLHLTVSDDGPGFVGEAILAGHGLDNLQGRLTALYGAQGTLAIESNQQQTTVQVSLPLAQ